MSKIRVCLVGFGYWGPNLARNIMSSKDFVLNFILEPDSDKHEKIIKLYPDVKILARIEDIQNLSNLIDVGVIATLLTAVSILILVLNRFAFVAGVV